MALRYNPRIVTENLVLNLDPSHNKSYPTDLPVKDGLVMWMDAADDTVFSYSSGTTVSQWRDKSVSGFHMVPKSSGPTRSSVLNSRKVLAFTTSQTIGNNTINLSSSANTVFVVSRLTGGTNGRVLTCNADASGNNWLLGSHGSTVNDYYAEGWVYDSATTADTTWRIYMGDWSGSSTDLANFYSNGTAIATNSSGASQGPNKLGVNYYSAETTTCEVAEIIVFNKVLSAIERKLIHTYLGQKWGILNTDRNVFDLAGNDDNGLFGNGSTSNMPLYDYYNKGAFKFYASNKYIKLGTSTTINQFSGDFTVSLWAMATAENSNWGNLIGDYYTAGVGTTGEWQIMMNNSSAFLSFYRVGTGNVINPISSGFSANTWINVVVTRVGSTITLYANNNVIATATNSSVFGSATGNVNIGIDGNNVAEPFSGLISNVLIYNKGLSATEVAQNYEAQKNRFTNSIVHQGLILNLDAGNPYSYAGAGTTWYDTSGNSNNGTLTNGPTYNSSNGGAIVFDGVNDYSVSTISSITASSTVAFWIKSSNYADKIPLSIDGDGYASGPNIFFNGNYINWNTGDGAGNPFTNSSYLNSDWHYILVTNDASTNAKLYVDGVLIGTATYKSTLSTASNNFWVGRFHGDNNYTINASIAQVQLYNRVLSATEALQNYNATKARFGL